MVSKFSQVRFKNTILSVSGAIPDQNVRLKWVYDLNVKKNVYLKTVVYDLSGCTT